MGDGTLHFMSDPLNLVIEQHLKEGIQHGFIPSEVANFLAYGVPGSGKTSLHYSLYDLPPPELRISTACIEQAQRAVLVTRSSEDSSSEIVICKPVEEQDLKEMLAKEMTEERITEEKKEVFSRIEKTLKENFPVEDHSSRPVSPSTQEPTPVEDHPPQHLLQPVSIPRPSPTPDEEATSHLVISPQVKLQGMDEILYLMLHPTPANLPRLRNRLVQFIDSGGQPKLLEMLPAYLRNLSGLMLVNRLLESLSTMPKAEYCDKDGKLFELGHFNLTNLEMLVKCAQLSRYHQSHLALPHVEYDDSPPDILVVGTFKDQEGKCKQTREEKNAQLEVAFKQFGKSIIRRSNGEIIFGVDATSRSDPVISELRAALKHMKCLHYKCPILWYLLEVELRKLGKKVIPKEYVMSIAKELHIEITESIEAALLFWHEINLIMYFPNILPEVVIFQPDAMIGMISQLYEQHIKISDTAECDISSSKDLRFRDQAVFSDDYAHDIKNETILSVDELLLILQDRKTVAKLPSSSSLYFMPSLLEELTEEELAASRSQLASQLPVASSLLVSFPTPEVPSGLFCTFISDIVSSSECKIPDLDSSTKLYRNFISITLNISPGSFGTLTLYNTGKIFSITPYSLSSSSFLPKAKKLVAKALDASCRVLSYRKLHQFSFQCECGQSPPHVAHLSPDEKVTTCSLDAAKDVNDLTKKQILWTGRLSDDCYFYSSLIIFCYSFQIGAVMLHLRLFQISAVMLHLRLCVAWRLQ